VIAYSLVALSANASHTRHLISTCREGGLFNSLIRQLPGFLNMSVLVSNQAEPEILLIIFFNSLDAATEATGSPTGVFLYGLLERMSKRSRNLGLFTFPSNEEKSEDDDRAQQLSSSAIVN
jgi:hypothetical protein